MIFQATATTAFLALLMTGCGEYARVTGRHAHNVQKPRGAPAASATSPTGDSSGVSADDPSAASGNGCGISQISVIGSPATCTDIPQAFSLTDLQVSAFADDDLDKQCQGINDFLTAFIAHTDSLKLSDYSCSLYPSMDADEALSYDVNFKVNRSDAKQLTFSLYATLGKSTDIQLDTTSVVAGTVYSNDFSNADLILRSDYDFSVPLLRLGPSLKAFFIAPATKTPTMFGKPYADVIKHECSDMQQNGLAIEDFDHKKTANISVNFADCATGATSGNLAVTAIPTDYFAGLTADAQLDNGFLGYFTAADVLAATDITWSFVNDTLFLARTLPHVAGADTETMGLTYTVQPY